MNLPRAFGWGWLLAVIIAILAMIAYGLLPQRGPLWLRITLAMTCFIGAYVAALSLLIYYGITK